MVTYVLEIFDPHIFYVTKTAPSTKGGTDAKWSSAAHHAFLWAGAEDWPWEGQDDRWWVHNCSGVITGRHTQLIAGIGQGWRAAQLAWVAVWYTGISTVRHCSARQVGLKCKGKIRITSPRVMASTHQPLHAPRMEGAWAEQVAERFWKLDALLRHVNTLLSVNS